MPLQDSMAVGCDSSGTASCLRLQMWELGDLILAMSCRSIPLRWEMWCPGIPWTLGTRSRRPPGSNHLHIQDMRVPGPQDLNIHVIGTPGHHGLKIPCMGTPRVHGIQGHHISHLSGMDLQDMARMYPWWELVEQQRLDVNLNPEERQDPHTGVVLRAISAVWATWNSSVNFVWAGPYQHPSPRGHRLMGPMMGEAL